ncbi:unnamed protein product, partial [Prorocentrum cordatum]
AAAGSHRARPRGRRPARRGEGARAGHRRPRGAMSLAQLLSLGKNDASSELIPSSTYEPPPEKPKKEPPPSEAKPAINQDELKLAQELVMAQEKVLQDAAEQRVKEQEAIEKQAFDDAAKAAAKRAEALKAQKIGSNPFSTGGKGDFKPGQWVCDALPGASRPIGGLSNARATTMGVVRPPSVLRQIQSALLCFPRAVQGGRGRRALILRTS